MNNEETVSNKEGSETPETKVDLSAAPYSVWLSKCVSYWESRIYEGDLGVDFSEAHERCWRCGYKRKLQKCHIVPKSLGGKDDVSNLIPLCGQCHDEAPDVDDPEYIWEWIKNDRGIGYDSYWGLRAIQSSGVNLSLLKEEDLCALKKEMQKNYKRVSSHCGQNNQGQIFSNSTRAWVIRQSVEAILKQNGKAKFFLD
tara:strand:+ start:58 stop:651 length:594 start_codon:yes stop_codon:yes gene_type:complete